MNFDNNANVPMTDAIIREYATGCKMGNILNAGPRSKIALAKMTQLTDELQNMFGPMIVTYTSGGSEGNSTVLAEYRNSHIVCSTVEHSSIVEVIKNWNVSWVKPAVTGHVPIAAILEKVGPTTGLVILQSVNSETGAMQAIDELLKKLNDRVAVHIDHVQGFMKYPKPIPYSRNRKMSIVVSFHKIGAPIGFGVLMTNYKFQPLIGGTQNSGMRGGTYNIGAVYASLRAMADYNYSKVVDLRNYFDKLVGQHMVVIPYAKFMGMAHSGDGLVGKYMVDLSCDGCLPHTIFICLGYGNTILCNMAVKERLAGMGIIIGTGSACNSLKQDELGSMRSADIPEVIKKGFLRISISCYNTKNEISALVRAL